MASTVIYATANAMNYNAASGWATTSGGSGSITLTGSDTGYTLDANGKTGIVLNINATVDGLQATDGTGYFALTTGTLTLTASGNNTNFVNYSGTNTSGMIRPSGGTLNIVGSGIGTIAVLSSSSGTAIEGSSGAAIGITNSGGGVGVKNTGTGYGVYHFGSGALIINVGAGNIACLVTTTNGTAVNYDSSNTSSLITGDIESQYRLAVGLLISGGGGKIGHTGQAIQSSTGQLSAIAAPVSIDGSGTYNPTGTVTLTSGNDNYILISGTSGTVSLNGLTMTCAGRLCINNLVGGTFTAGATPGTITLSGTAGQAVVLGSAFTVTPASSGGVAGPACMLSGGRM